jgi:putative ABC transport system permease protein
MRMVTAMSLETFMRLIRTFLMRLGGLFHKEQRDRDLVEEIESHLQLQIEDNLRAGMNPERARRNALLKSGGIESIKEDYRERSSLPLLESLLQDLHYGARTLRKNPAFTTVAVVTLALGIGGCAAMYAYIQQLVLWENPYPGPDSLVVVHEVDSLDARSNRGINGRALTAIKEHGRFFEDIGGYTTDGFVLMSNDALPILDGANVTPNIFEILGVKPLLGRTFREEQGRPANENVVVISERAWKRYLGGRPEVVGSTIDLSRKLYTVIGIMPDGFWRDRDVWTPLTEPPSEAGHMRTWARLSQPDVHQQAQAELNILSQSLASDYPETQGTWKLALVNPFEMSAGQLGMLGALLVAPVALVFLIVCVNIAHLQLGRDMQRSREMAVRLAIGASRFRLTRQLLTESLLLALLGGALGVVFASWGINAISAYLPAGSLELIGRLRLDRNASLFLVLLSAASSVLFGLLPALRVSGLSLTAVLKQGSRPTSRISFRNWLVISELALSTTLLVGTGMMVVLLRHVTHTHMGFDERNLWTARLSLRGPIRSDDGARRNWAATTIEQIEALPGVTSAAIASELPLLGGAKRWFESVGQIAVGQTAAPDATFEAEYRAVSATYFETLRIPLRQGRVFNDDDREGATPVVVINETMARRFFPEGALGRRLRIFPVGTSPGLPSNPATELREVVGIVADVRQTPIDALPVPPIAYVPDRQHPIATLSLVVRTQGSPDKVARAILDRINAPSPEVILQSMFVFDRAIRDRVRGESFLPISMAVFAVFGLVLSGVGLYGTASHAVVQRTREFGIRQALGARAADVVRLVLGQSALGGAIGLALGAAGSLAAATLLLKMLSPSERSAFGADLLSGSEVFLVGAGAAVLLIAVILLAAYLPSRRATKVDPVTALRYE